MSQVSSLSAHQRRLVGLLARQLLLFRNLAEEYGLEPAVEVSRAKAAVAEAAER